ncbi:MAG: hypothetical protein R6U11_10680 [Bacteroidales bacterium]
MINVYNLLTIILVAGIVFATSYFLLREFFQNELKKRHLTMLEEQRKVSLPVRLQAYERIILFLERISPANLVIRTHKAGLSATQFHQILIHTIREEYDHNLSQQLYVSNKAWEMVKKAKEEMIRQINTSAGQLEEDSNSADLSKKVLDMSVDRLATKKALDFLKTEARKIF